MVIPPEDNKTLSLPLVTKNRGRGRPRKPDALSNAQRQAAFRARKKAAEINVTVTKNVPAVVDRYDELVQERDRLREELADARRGNGGGVMSEDRVAANHWWDEYQLLLYRAREYLVSADRLIPRYGPVKRNVAIQLRDYLRDLSVDRLDSGETDSKL